MSQARIMQLIDTGGCILCTFLNLRFLRNLDFLIKSKNGSDWFSKFWTIKDIGSEETKNYFFILLKGVVVTKYCTYKVTMSVIELVKTPLFPIHHRWKSTELLPASAQEKKTPTTTGTEQVGLLSLVWLRVRWVHFYIQFFIVGPFIRDKLYRNNVLAVSTLMVR